MASLVEGFESPFGLELLTTAHWVMKSKGAADLDDVIAGFYDWHPRKRQFTPRQIGIAVDRLLRRATSLEGKRWLLTLKILS